MNNNETETPAILRESSDDLPSLREPVKVALVGAGQRAQLVYRPLWRALHPYIQVVAVCDPIRENAESLADALNVPAFFDIRELARARPMEAAVVVTPIDSHFAISTFLSSLDVHNLVETSWCNTLRQARRMVETAREHDVVTRVAENFFRFPADRIAQITRDSDYLGRIGRVFSYADHTGYHNNSRWLAFAQKHPSWVQCIENTMPHPPFYESPQRRHESEKLSARTFGWDDFLVMDTGSGHVKGHLGRHRRPGYTEWQGERGTLLHQGHRHGVGGEETVLLHSSDSVFAPTQEADNRLSAGGIADEITVVTHEMNDVAWTRSFADTPQGRLQWTNTLHPPEPVLPDRLWYGTPVMGHLVDFALALRGVRASEFDDEAALMSMMMEVGARESALREGKRLALPLEGETEADAREHERLHLKHGCDPFDIEAMLAISYPKP